MSKEPIPSPDLPQLPVLSRLRRMARRFARTKRSAVSMELAIIALPFFILFLGTMEVAYDVFVQSALNAAMAATARQIYDGTVQAVDGSSGGATFVKNYMCPNVRGMLQCGLIQVNIHPLPAGKDFFSYTAPAYETGAGPSYTLATSTWSVCTGNSGVAVLFQAVYAGPTFVGALMPAFVLTYNGAYIHPTYTSDAFWVAPGFTSTASGCS